MAKVAKRRDRWVLDFVDQNGRRRWETLAAGTTRKGADVALSVMLGEIGKGTFQATREQTTFAESAELFFSTHVDVELRDSSKNDYGRIIRHYLTPYFADRRVREIRFEHVKKLRAELLEGWPVRILEHQVTRRAALSAALAAKRKNHALERTVDAFRAEILKAKPGASTVAKCISHLSILMRFCIVNRWTDHNPADGVRKGGVRIHKADVAEILSPAEVAKVLASATSERWRLMLMTAAFCGLRSGEIRGLAWGDLDFNSSKVHVRRAADLYGKKLRHTSLRVTMDCYDHLMPDAAGRPPERIGRHGFQRRARQLRAGCRPNT
jgi:integrase